MTRNLSRYLEFVDLHIGAGLVIGATVRGGRIVADPQELPEQRPSTSLQPARARSFSRLRRPNR